MYNGFRLVTQRLLLRPVLPDDLDPIWEAATMPELVEGLEWDPPQDKDLLADQLMAEEVSEKWFPLVIAHKDGGFLGRAFLSYRQDQWRVGYWLLPKHRGQGYATEAVCGLLQYAFSALKAPSVWGRCLPWNDASRAVLKRAGMQYESLVKGGHVKRGKRFDVEAWYALPRESL